MAGFQILTVNYLRLRLVVAEVFKKWLIWKVYAKISRYKNSDVASLRLDFGFKIVSWKILFLRKQPTSRDATTGFLAKWRLINERKNSILTTCHRIDMGSASDWLIGTAQPIRSTTQIWIVTRHQYGILRRHFVGQISSGASRNFGCFLALESTKQWQVSCLPRDHWRRGLSGWAFLPDCWDQEDD